MQGEMIDDSDSLSTISYHGFRSGICLNIFASDSKGLSDTTRLCCREAFLQKKNCTQRYLRSYVESPALVSRRIGKLLSSRVCDFTLPSEIGCESGRSGEPGNLCNACHGSHHNPLARSHPSLIPQWVRGFRRQPRQNAAIEVASFFPIISVQQQRSRTRPHAEPTQTFTQ